MVFRVSKISAAGDGTVAVVVAEVTTKGLARRLRVPLVVFVFPTFF